MKELYSLIIDNCSLNDEFFINCLSNIPSTGIHCKLRELHISRNQITDKGICALVDLFELCGWNHCDMQSLRVAHNEISDDGAQAIAKMIINCKVLEHIDLSGNKVISKIFL
jgi:hypothetical protein